MAVGRSFYFTRRERRLLIEGSDKRVDRIIEISGFPLEREKRMVYRLSTGEAKS